MNGRFHHTLYKLVRIMCKNCKKLNDELTELREFKRKHDEQLMALVGSTTLRHLEGKRTLGYQNNFWNGVIS